MWYVHKKEGNLAISNNMDGMELEGNMLNEISLTDKDKYHIISLICEIQNKKQKNELMNTENRLVVAGGGR